MSSSITTCGSSNGLNRFNRRLHSHRSLLPSSLSASILKPSVIELKLRYYYRQGIGNLRGGDIVNANPSMVSYNCTINKNDDEDEEESIVTHHEFHKTNEKDLLREPSFHDESTIDVENENTNQTTSCSCKSISSTNNNNTNFNTIKTSKMQNAIERTIPSIIMLLFLQQLITHTGETGLYILIPLMQFKMYKETTGIIEEYYKLKYQRKQILVRRRHSRHRHRKTDSKEEVVVVVERGNNFDLKVNIEKWWWFMTIFVTTTARFLRSEIIFRLSSSSSMLNNNESETSFPSSSIIMILVHQLYSIIENEYKFNLVVYGMVSIGLIMVVVGMASHVDASADKFRSYLGEVASFHFALVSFSTLNNLEIHLIYHTLYMSRV